MNLNAPKILLLGTIMSALAATTVLIREARRASPTSVQAIEFQTMVGGVGLGTEADFARCELGFDPRQSGVCSETHGLTLGGTALCPCHSFSVLFLRGQP